MVLGSTVSEVITGKMRKDAAAKADELAKQKQANLEEEELVSLNS